jgi:hypothetical protein
MTNPHEPTPAEQTRDEYLQDQEARQRSADRRARAAVQQRGDIRKRPAPQQTRPEPPVNHGQQLAQEYLEQRRQEARERQQQLRATGRSGRDLDNQGLGY